MVLLALQVGVEQRLIAFAAAPENIVLAAELLRDLQRFFHLRRRVGEDVRVGIRRRAAHVARIGKQIRRAPEQLHAGGFLQLLRVRDDLVEVAVRLGERTRPRARCRGHGSIERRLDFREKLKRGIHARLRDGDGIAAVFPRPHDRARPERIARPRRGTNASRRWRTACAPSASCRRRSRRDYNGGRRADCRSPGLRRRWS